MKTTCRCGHTTRKLPKWRSKSPLYDFIRINAMLAVRPDLAIGSVGASLSAGHLENA